MTLLPLGWLDYGYNISLDVDPSFGGARPFRFIMALSLTELVLGYLAHHHSHNFQSDPS